MTNKSESETDEGPGTGGRGERGGGVNGRVDEGPGVEGEGGKTEMGKDGAAGVAGDGGMWLGGIGKESRRAGTGVRRDVDLGEGDALPCEVRCDSEETRLLD